MTSGSPPRTPVRTLLLLGGVVALVFLLTVSIAGGPTGAPDAHGSAATVSPRGTTSTAASVRDLLPGPTEAVAGVPVTVGWEAFTSAGTRASDFAVVCDVRVTETNGSAAPAWVNATATGALPRLANGTFQVPSPAWNAGVLDLTVDLAWAAPVTVQLLGSALPNVPGPVALAVLPDLEHLVISDPTWLNFSENGTWWSSALWHVRDRFGDPAPGATLLVEFSTGTALSQTFVPVTWSTGGITVAWVNYTAPRGTEGTVTVEDGAGTVLWGPFGLPALSSAPASTSSPLPPLALAAVALLGVGGFAGVGILLSGGRARSSPASTEGEEELRRLAEGRAAVVEIVRHGGPLALHEIEARWEPPPAPPAVADWVASLVTDGTLTATLEEGGRARFALAERPAGEPWVTLDEEALERGIARRDAAVERTDEEAER